jgi:hypothetical protein
MAKIEPPGTEFGVALVGRDRLFALARCIADAVPLPPIGVGAPALSRQYLLRVSEAACTGSTCAGSLDLHKFPAISSTMARELQAPQISPSAVDLRCCRQ